MCLTESWHDSTSVATARLRAQGYNVADRPRPRIRDDMSTNHGGIVVFSSAFAQLSILPLDSPSTFETLCVRVTSGRRSEIVVVIYRPGSQAISSRFFDDVTALLDHVATFAAPVFVCGDFNVRFDRPDDQHAVRLRSLLTCHGLPLRSTGPTHVGGGTLDAVAANAVYDINATVTDVGISDHAAICWSGATANRPSPTSCVAGVRPWRKLDLDLFRSAISTSRLCRPELWPTNLDELSELYDAELTTILDRILPLCSSPLRRRPTDPWFDADCRASKRLTRRLERRYASLSRRYGSSQEAVAAKTECYTHTTTQREFGQFFH
jgi:hypothetical protein